MILSPCRKCIIRACCTDMCIPYKKREKFKYNITYYWTYCRMASIAIAESLMEFIIIRVLFEFILIFIVTALTLGICIGGLVGFAYLLDWMFGGGFT